MDEATRERLDRRYDEIVAKYPEGITPAQFRRIALESADDTDRIYPHPVEFFAMHSMLLGMAMDGVIQNRGGPNDPMRWFITDKGRAEIASLTHPPHEEEREKMSDLPWIKIEGLESLPKKPGKEAYEHVECLIWLKHGAERVMWNCEHGVWDDEDGDDFRFKPLEPTHYLIITKPNP